MLVAIECPDADKHTPRPAGYAAFNEWAEEMDLTHRVERCPSCGLYAIWVPHTVAKSDETSTHNQQGKHQ